MNIPYLQSGDRVYLLSTARAVPSSELEQSLQTLKSWGLEVTTGQTIGKVDHQYAGTDPERRKDLQDALDDEQVKAIFCCRGGYGTVRIVDGLDFSRFIKKPKWVAGYSDVTVLHAHLYERFGAASIHGVMPSIFRYDAPGLNAQATLKKALFGEPLDYLINHAHPTFRTGSAEGVLVGGNLSILYSLAGSVSDVKTEGKILFIEDVDEYLYHIDRMMVALKRAGKLNGLKGLIVGGMSSMNDNEIPFGKTAEEIVFEHVREFNYPVCFKFPAGHLRDNHALRLGSRAWFTVTSTDIVLKFL